MIGDIIEIARARHGSADESPPTGDAPSLVPEERRLTSLSAEHRRESSFLQRTLDILSIYIAGWR